MIDCLTLIFKKRKSRNHKMNFVKTKDGKIPKLMKDGDLVILYEGHESMDHLYLEAGKIFNNKFGSFYHADFIGKPYGSKICSKSKPGWLYSLEPTPELWSLALNTRTQIVDEVDSSVIIMNMDLFPGCVVVESGTGSGCMTLSIARAIAPNGHVFTYEYNESRSKSAKDEFEKLAVQDLITVTHRDVCAKIESEGGFSGVSSHSADAVFLDLPEPWLAVSHVLKVLKPSRTVCSYSPCIEQVMKTCEQLRRYGFHSVRMIEVRKRPFDARKITFENVNLGRKEDILAMAAHPDGPSDARDSQDTEAGESKKRKEPPCMEDQDPPDGTSEKPFHRSNRNQFGSFYVAPRIVNVARPYNMMKGHTAFLTFATSPLPVNKMAVLQDKDQDQDSQLERTADNPIASIAVSPNSR